MLNKKIALVSVIEKRNNPQKFSESVWMFADKGWKIAYINYCENLTSNFHTASPKNVRELFMKILGIRDITKSWNYLGLPPSTCVEKLDDLVSLRHDIAHGANERYNVLEEHKIREQTNFITSIAQNTYKIVFNHTADLSFTQALEYSLAPSYFSAIIEFAARKGDKILTLKEIKKIGSSAQGNHNKLCYEPWALLEKIDQSTRRIPDRLIQFFKNEISLPLEILVFDNKEAIAKPGTREVLFSELQ